MKKEIRRCPTCNAKMVEYRHNLNKNIISCMFVFLKHDGVIEFCNVGGEMTFNQKNNFQKLQYWGLIRKVKDEETGERLGGFWALTEKGMQFLKGKISVEKNAWTYRNETVRLDGEKKFVHEYGWEAYRQHHDYNADAKPRFLDGKNQLKFWEDNDRPEPRD